MFNPNELILDRVRSLTAHDPANNELLFRLTSLEEPSLQVTSEGEEVTDAVGAIITTLYRSTRATFSATNSLFSLDLAAEQFGAKKQIAGLKDLTYGNEVDANAVINDYIYEILPIADGKIKLAHKPNAEIKYIYTIENNNIGTRYAAGTEASATEFVYSDETQEITVPTGVTGKIYVEYTFDTANAVRVTKKTSKYPRMVSLVIYCYFKDVCNENLVYSVKIIANKAKLNPEQVEIALTSTGKHAFDFVMLKDYCEDDADLFSIIVSE